MWVGSKTAVRVCSKDRSGKGGVAVVLLRCIGMGLLIGRRLGVFTAVGVCLLLSI